MDKEQKREEWIPQLIFVVGLIAFFVPVILWTIAKCRGLDSGIIGDTIGGSTAPIIGILSSLLLYFSFSSQVKANRIAQQEANFKYLLEEFKQMQLFLSKFRYVELRNDNVLGNPNKYKGIDGIQRLTENLFTKYNSAIPSQIIKLNEPCNNLLYNLKNYYYFVKEISNLTSNQNPNFKRIAEDKIVLFHDEKIAIHVGYLSMINYENEPDDNVRNSLIEIKKISNNIINTVAGFSKPEPNEETEI